MVAFFANDYEIRVHDAQLFILMYYIPASKRESAGGGVDIGVQFRSNDQRIGSTIDLFPPANAIKNVVKVCPFCPGKRKGNQMPAIPLKLFPTAQANLRLQLALQTVRG